MINLFLKTRHKRICKACQEQMCALNNACERKEDRQCDVNGYLIVNH